MRALGALRALRARVGGCSSTKHDPHLEQYWPAAQAPHSLALTSPAAALAVPAGQGCATDALNPQWKPAGQSSGAASPGSPHTKPAGQPRHDVEASLGL